MHHADDGHVCDDIHEDVVATLLGQGREVPIRTRLEYLRSDPYAVHVEFTTGKKTTTEWTFARDLLVAALTSPAWVGDGDIRLCRMDDDHLALRLESPSGRASFLLGLLAVSGFVGKTLVAVPLGDEAALDGIDAEISSEMTRGVAS